MNMKPFLSVALILTFRFALLAAGPGEKSPKPQYDAKGNLLRPAEYRDWEFLSAGLGMNYSPLPAPNCLPTSSCSARLISSFWIRASGPSRLCSW